MKLIGTELPGVAIVEPAVFGDDRGFFYESYNALEFDRALGREIRFVQDNHSRSARNVLRGLHYQLAPRSQGKLVRVIAGAVFDVAVDLRRSSPAFGRWFSATLSAENRRQLWIPAGLAHGFLALAEGTEIVYKTTDYYAPDLDRTIAWNDADLAIDWPIEGDPVLSPRDAAATALADAELFD